MHTEVWVWVVASLTLSAHHYEGDLRHGPVGGQLVVDFVNFLEARLIFQTEDQDDSVHPTSQLRGRERRAGWGWKKRH